MFSSLGEYAFSLLDRKAGQKVVEEVEFSLEEKPP